LPNAKYVPFDLKLDLSEHLKKLKPYVSGKPIEQTKREFGLSEVIKLASNENPTGASPRALEAVRKTLEQSHLYPDASYQSLKNAIAKKRMLDPNQVVVGAGSNEIIDLAIRVLLHPGQNCVAPAYSFIAYQLCAELNGVEFRTAKLDADFAISVDQILAVVDANTRVVFLANPNNPTGITLEAKELRRLASGLLKKNVILCLDYAYWEFADSKDFPAAEDLLVDYPNLLVLHTFSKIYGLAGFRVGYGLGRPELIQWIERARQPFNVSSIAIEAAIAALEDQAFLIRVKEQNAKERERLAMALSRLGLRVYGSNANFVFVDLHRDAEQVNSELLKRGVIIRPLLNYGLKTQVRVTVGLPQENDKLLKALKEVLV